MSMKNCKECGKEVSTKAASCPNCGAILKKKTGCLTYLVAGFLVLFLLGIIGSQIGKNSSAPSTKPASGLIIPSIGKQIVTFDAYQKIQNGMSYKQVVSIIGTNGEEISQNKLDAVPGVMESVETIMYQWMNSNGSNMNAMFQNDKLMQKAQFGLK